MILYRLVATVLILTFVSASSAKNLSARGASGKTAEAGDETKDMSSPVLTLKDHWGDFWSCKYLTGDWGGG